MKTRIVTGAAAASILVLLLFMHGAVPFLAVPTLGQAVWTTGFSQSFLNDSFFSVYATNFGAPQPAPIAFGLAGAWPVAFLIACGLHPADAYSAMAALWLSFAFLSAYHLSHMFHVSPALSIAGAVLWSTMPIIWAHADYSMLSFGIALLPFYFLCALNLLLREPRFSIPTIVHALLYVLACLISVFMDGYSFVMFVVGSSLLGGWLFTSTPPRRRPLLLWALPVHVIGIGMSYVLYVVYVGASHDELAPLEAFRAWGLDLTFLVVPTEGVHWIADALGLSTPRSEDRFFGDPSVWRSTFALPLLVAALWAWWRMRRTSALASGCLLILLSSLYMALGPSLKIHATKPAGQELSQLMPAHHAVAPTGSGWLSSRVPGLRSMRAAYRWLALTVFSGWFLLILLLSARKRADVFLAAAVVSGVAIINLPDIPQKWKDDAHNREMFLRIDSDLVKDMQQVLEPRQRVAFLPYRNDFLVNYLAARLNIVSYNIGGDKNLDQARRHWPETMREFRKASVDEAFPGHVIVLLARREADSVVLPYVDMLWAAHRWPRPAEFKETLQPAISVMKKSNFVAVIERDHYAVVKLNEESARMADSGALESAVLRQFCMPPICLRQNRFASGTPSQAGLWEDGRLVSDRRRGFLHLGPHYRMAAGRYRFAVYGTGVSAAQGWVEVVSGRAGVSARFPLSAGRTGREGGAGVLAEGLVTLELRADDLEVRVFVGEEDVIRLDGYELVPTRLSAQARPTPARTRNP